MGIRKDAEEILVYVYKHKLEDKGMPEMNDLISLTSWEKNRVIFAMEYLIRANLVDGEVIGGLGITTQHIYFTDISPSGINVIESEKEFERHFEHTVDLKFYKFSWGASEKK